MMLDRGAQQHDGLSSLRTPALAVGPALTFRIDEIFLTAHLIDMAMGDQIVGWSESDAKGRLLRAASEADPHRVASQFIHDNLGLFFSRPRENRIYRAGHRLSDSHASSARGF